MEIQNRAKQIEKSGDWMATLALNRGKKGVTDFYPPDDRRIEAYRTGLNLFFQKSGWDNHFVAEEVVTGDIALQQGFFNRFRIRFPISLVPISKEEEANRQIDIDSYQRTLRQYRNFNNKGIDIGYSSYLRGALIAIRVQRTTIRESIETFSKIVNSPATPEDTDQEVVSDAQDENPEEMLRINYDGLRKRMADYEDYLKLLTREKEILEMALKDPTYPIDLSFSPEEIKRLEFLKKLRREGKI